MFKQIFVLASILGILYGCQNVSSSPAVYSFRLSELGPKAGYILIERSAGRTQINVQNTTGEIVLVYPPNAKVECAANFPGCAVVRQGN